MLAALGGHQMRGNDAEVGAPAVWAARQPRPSIRHRLRRKPSATLARASPIGGRRRYGPVLWPGRAPRRHSEDRARAWAYLSEIVALTPDIAVP